MTIFFHGDFLVQSLRLSLFFESSLQMPNQYSQLGNQIFIHHGSINVGILRDGNRALLIDCGDGSVRSNPQCARNHDG